VLRALAHRLGRPVAEVEADVLARADLEVSGHDGLTPPGYWLLEFTVPDHPERRTRIRDLRLPAATLVIVVHRGDNAFPPWATANCRQAIAVDQVRHAITAPSPCGRISQGDAGGGL
jgi:hypothetical protein